MARAGEALCVIDEDHALVGLLTGFDFTLYLRQLTEDSLAVADVEAAVKQLIQRHYNSSPDDLQAAVVAQVRGSQRSLMKDVQKVVNACLEEAGAEPLKRSKFQEIFDAHYLSELSGEFERLSFAQFNVIFLEKGCWSSYETPFGLPHDAVRRLLDDARLMRNRLAHHRGSLSATERDRLNYCRRLMNRVADLHDGEGTGNGIAEPEEVALEAAEEGYHESSEDDGPATYEALARHMESFSGKLDRVVLKFETVDRLVGGLTNVAYEHRAWWSNDEDSPQAKAWLDAGWRMVSVNLTNQTVTFGRNTVRHEAYISAFNRFYRRLDESSSWRSDTPSPAGRNWQYISRLPQTGKQTASFVLAFAKDQRFRIELYIDTGDREINKATFDALHAQADDIAAEASVELTWERLDGKRACRIAAYYPTPISFDDDDEAMEELAAWVEQVAPALHQALEKRDRVVKPKKKPR